MNKGNPYVLGINRKRGSEKRGIGGVGRSAHYSRKGTVGGGKRRQKSLKEIAAGNSYGNCFQKRFTRGATGSTVRWERAVDEERTVKID